MLDLKLQYICIHLYEILINEVDKKGLSIPFKIIQYIFSEIPKDLYNRKMCMYM